MDKPNLKTPNSTQGESGVVPEETIYQKPLKPKKIMDKTGWKLGPENEMIVNGKLLPANKNAGLLPEGFDPPSSNKATKGKS